MYWFKKEPLWYLYFFAPKKQSEYTSVAVPFWPLDPGSGMGVFRLPDLKN